MEKDLIGLSLLGARKRMIKHCLMRECEDEEDERACDGESGTEEILIEE
jgi:hypothetical protein